MLGWRHFHDVGKVATPDAILLKEGPLTDDEFAVMRQHPKFSTKCCRCQITRLWLWLRVLRSIITSAGMAGVIRGARGQRNSYRGIDYHAGGCL